MSFRDEVTKAQFVGRQKPTELERKRKTVDLVVDALIANVKQQILKEAEKNCHEGAVNIDLYFAIPAWVHPEFDARLNDVSAFTTAVKLVDINKGKNEYSVTEELRYLISSLSKELKKDEIIVSNCLVGTTTPRMTGAPETNLGVCIEYYGGDSFPHASFWNDRVNVYQIYNQFDTTQPVRVVRGFSLFGAPPETIVQNGISQRITKYEEFEFFVKMSYSS